MKRIMVQIIDTNNTVNKYDKYLIDNFDFIHTGINTWEAPTWTGFIGAQYPDAEYFEYDISNADKFHDKIEKCVKDNKKTILYFSLMETNKEYIKYLTEILSNDLKCNNDAIEFVIGISVGSKTFRTHSRFKVSFHHNIEEVVNFGIITSLNFDAYLKYNKMNTLKLLRVQNTSGCFYGCSFCTVPHIKFLYRTELYIKTIEKYNPKFIYFDDKTYNLNADIISKRLKDIEQNPIKIIQTRIDTILDIVENDNFDPRTIIELGVEFYNDKLYDKYHKQITVKEVDYVLNRLSELNLFIGVNLIYDNNINDLITFMDNFSQSCIKYYNIYNYCDYENYNSNENVFTNKLINKAYEHIRNIPRVSKFNEYYRGS